MEVLILVAKGDPGSGAVGAFMTLAMIVALLIWWVAMIAGDSGLEMSVVLKDGVPYCRRCGRQVSRRRDYCRACGLSMYVPKLPPPATGPAGQDGMSRAEAALRDAELLQREAIRKNAERWRLEDDRRRADREAARSARRAERDDAYRADGIEPGPWAWFQALPEVAQAVLLGLTFALPAGGLAWVVFASW